MLTASIRVPAFFKNDTAASRTRSATTANCGQRQLGSSRTNGCGGPRKIVREKIKATTAATRIPMRYMEAKTTAGKRIQEFPTVTSGTNALHRSR